MVDDHSSTPFPDLQTLATLAPVARQSVVDAVADRLRGEVLSGRLRPGTRLPSERELSLALGVNRLTLRASLARLEALGLITTRHGAGSVVASWRERAGLEMLGTLVKGLKFADPAWHDLVRSALELRRILASEAVALAAERHTEEDVDAIATCAQVPSRETSPDDALAFARADLAFMRAVCRAARNVGLELFLNMFARWPDDNPQLVAVLYDDTARSVELYPAILDIIKSRDGQSARTISRAALEEIDAGWARRHPPPMPSVTEPVLEPSPERKEAAMKLSQFETAWAEAEMHAIFPGASEEGWPTSARWTCAASSAGSCDGCWLRAALGLRLAIWMVALAPVLVLGRLATFGSLALVDRERVLTRLAASSWYAVRSLVTLLKTMGALLYAGNQAVRARMTSPSGRGLVKLRVKSFSTG